MFHEKGARAKSEKLTGKHLCQSLFFNKVAALWPLACNFIKKETQAQMFSCKFCKICKNTFFLEHLWWRLLYIPKIYNLNTSIYQVNLMSML